METERRMIIKGVTLRDEGEDAPSVISGTAAVFNTWSGDLGGFEERIAPGAFAEALETSDVRALFNHDPSLLLGRSSAGTLRLQETRNGLEFEIDLANTTVARDVAENIRARNVQGNSFSFTVGDDEWEERDGDLPRRTVTRVSGLFDVGPVTFPAYEVTKVSARALDRVVQIAEPPRSVPMARYRAEQAWRARHLDRVARQA